MTVMTAIRSAETEAAREAEKRIAEARALLPQDEHLAAFFDALYASAVPDDVLRARADQLTQLAMALHAQTDMRARGDIRVVALELGHETVLVCINDDRPFLFDFHPSGGHGGRCAHSRRASSHCRHRRRAHQHHRAGLRSAE